MLKTQNFDGYVLLTMAIVRQAVVDYMKALCLYHKYSSNTDECEVEKLEYYLLSNKYEIYTNISGKYLVKKAQEVCKESNYEWKRVRRYGNPEIMMG